VIGLKIGWEEPDLTVVEEGDVEDWVRRTKVQLDPKEPSNPLGGNAIKIGPFFWDPTV
jgi:hypothetical protein